MDGIFVPSLLKAEVAADMVNYNEIVWITCWWQNIGDAPSERPLQMFAEMELGHQRLPETNDRYCRTYWEPYPSTNTWKPGQIVKTTCRWPAKPSFGGTCRIHLGICGSGYVPVDLHSDIQGKVKQIYVGEVDVGWGWGQPRIDAMKRPWAKDFNRVRVFENKDTVKKEDSLELGRELMVKLCGAFPSIMGIGDGSTFFEHGPATPEILIRDRFDDSTHYNTEPRVSQKYALLHVDENNCRYSAAISYKGSPAAGFELCFRMMGSQMELTLENCTEAPGIELLYVKLPSVITAYGPGVNVLEFYGGGRLIPLETALPIGYCHHYDIRNAYAVYNAGILLALESFCLDDRVLVSIEDDTKAKTANIGLLLINRVKACGNLESIRVESSHSVKINLVGDAFGKPSWQSAARFFRKDLEAGNTDLYKRALVYKYLATQGPNPPEGSVKEDSGYGLKRLKSVRRYEDILKDIIGIHNILDGIPQVAYIGGFQKGGFDDFPGVFEVDSRTGTMEELKACISEGKKYNAVVGLHDNYDDFSAYNPDVDKSLVAIDEEGRPWKGWIWAGGLSYIVSPLKYSKSGRMQERVKKTVELYGLSGSSHCDVLSAEVLRFDFDPQCPSSADKSINGKIDVIREYNKYGIDLTSENLSHPFVGHMGFALWTKSDAYESLFLTDRYIPLSYMVYHGYIGYAGISRNKIDLLRHLIGGNGYFFEEEHTSPGHIQWIYLQSLPAGMLLDRVIRDVVEEGEKVTVLYDERTYVKVDFSAYEYEIVIDGQPIARNFTVFAPGFREGAWLAYSMDGGRLEYPVPEAWKGLKDIYGVELTLDGEGSQVRCAVENGKVILDMKAGVPVRVQVR